MTANGPVVSGPSAESFRLLVESVKDYGIFMLDPKGYVSTWNAGAERIKGYAAAEIVGKHFSIFYPPEDVASGKCEHELSVAERSGHFEDEGWRLRRDGKKFWANVVITALRDANGALVGFGKVMRDLTDRLEVEAERVRRARAEEADRRKEDFLAILGHELRNPLSPMVSAVHLIKLRRGWNCDREIAVLDRQLVHMMRLVDDLLDLSRTMRGQLVFERTTLDVGQAIQNAVEVASPEIDRKGHRLEVDVRGPLFADADPTRLMQVFANILGNAVKYTPPGGHIRVRAAAEGETLSIAFADDGPGIPEEMRANIFDLFTQGHQAMDRSLGGLGIGLAVAKRLVEEHGGSITLEPSGSAPGSTFTVRLPRSTRADRASPGWSAERPRSQGRVRVLLVDDNEDSVEMMSTLLAQRGHDVRTAHTGPAALDVLADFLPQIAILDIGLPGMNGFELARKLRSTEACATIPIVALTGYARASDRRTAEEAGFDLYLVKPLETARLIELVETGPARAADRAGA
ncbi:MAG: ATP-binding protein [Polyangiaceae bacterium]